MKSKLVKPLILVALAILLVVVTVFTTIALMVSTASVSNTFTVGNMKITMRESKVDEDGKDQDGAEKTVDTNTYKLVPAVTYIKDPSLYIESGSEDSYIFIKIRNQISHLEKGNYVHSDGQIVSDPEKPTIAQQLSSHGWKYFGENATGEIYFYAGNDENQIHYDMNSAEYAKLDSKDGTQWIQPTVIGTKSETQTIDLFDEFTIDDHAVIDASMGAAKITVMAYAIQSSAFAKEATDGLNADETLKIWKEITEEVSFESTPDVNTPYITAP